MSNKKNKQELAKEAEQKAKELHTQYEGYVKRIEARSMPVKSYDDWVRKASKVIDGQTVEFIAAGDSGETKNEKFIRLGKSRMEKALNGMDLLINLASPQYEVKPEQLDKMINALRLKVTDIENSFKATGTVKEAFEF
jgi:23S rRNA pseudoU1915 N3-methylase RlmH